jgi:hypothetical protein
VYFAILIRHGIAKTGGGSSGLLVLHVRSTHTQYYTVTTYR